MEVGEINITKDWLSRQADINLVCGNICSGKNTFCSQFTDTHEHIVVSDIVKSIINSTERSELQDTKHLADAIAVKLVELVDKALLRGKKVMVDGIRQISLIWLIASEYKDYDRSIIWLDCDTHILKQRYESRAAEKDKSLTFEDAMEADRELGIKEIESFMNGGSSHPSITSSVKKIIIKHHTQI